MSPSDVLIETIVFSLLPGALHEINSKRSEKATNCFTVVFMKNDFWLITSRKYECKDI
jgi:hypothetical protein